MDYSNYTPEFWIKNNNLCSEKLKNESFWDSIPSLNVNPLHELRDNCLVRFQGMVQDMHNPEYYFEEYVVKNEITGETTVKCGRYRDTTDVAENEVVQLNCDESKTKERHSLVVISFPGLNDWVYNVDKDKNKTTNISAPTNDTDKKSLKRSVNEDDNMETESTSSESTAANNENKKLCITKKNATNSIVSPEHILNLPLPGRDGKCCIVKVYDNGDALKLNDMIDIVGFLSVDPKLIVNSADDELDTDMESLTHNPPPSLVPRIHCIAFKKIDRYNPLLKEITLEESMSTLKHGLMKVLTQLLFGDGLAAEYLLCHLISRVYGYTCLTKIIVKDDPVLTNFSRYESYLFVSRGPLGICQSMFEPRITCNPGAAFPQASMSCVAGCKHYILELNQYLRKDLMALGKFSLNLSNVPSQAFPNYGEQLYEFLQLLVTKSHYLPLTLDNLNDLSFSPKKDYECNRLTSGILQLSNGTHLVLDETKMQPGTLQPAGGSNLGILMAAIDNQKVYYDFEFYHTQIDCDIPVLVVSEALSMLPNDVHVPLLLDTQCVQTWSSIVDASKYYLQPELLNKFRVYLTKARHATYNLSDDIMELVQNEFIEQRQSNGMTADDLHHYLVLARLLCLSKGKETLDAACWRKACNMERVRKARVPPK